MTNSDYYNIVKHYEDCFQKYGATYRGMDWPNEEDLVTRFEVMLKVIKADTQKKISILDLGCGVGLLIDHLQARGGVYNYDYWGIDLSEQMVTEASEHYPSQKFEKRDILLEPLHERCVDYVIMNGLLTEKNNLNQRTMEEYARSIIKKAFSACRRGIAFNVMSTHVDWERKDLFHWSLDKVVSFLVAECSRSIVIRMDYGLYEYTVYVYREAGK